MYSRNLPLHLCWLAHSVDSSMVITTLRLTSVSSSSFTGYCGEIGRFPLGNTIALTLLSVIRVAVPVLPKSPTSCLPAAWRVGAPLTPTFVGRISTARQQFYTYTFVFHDLFFSRPFACYLGCHLIQQQTDPLEQLIGPFLGPLSIRLGISDYSIQQQNPPRVFREFLDLPMSSRQLDSSSIRSTLSIFRLTGVLAVCGQICAWSYSRQHVYPVENVHHSDSLALMLWFVSSPCLRRFRTYSAIRFHCRHSGGRQNVLPNCALQYGHCLPHAGHFSLPSQCM